jgi:hypothetical protein
VKTRSSSKRKHENDDDATLNDFQNNLIKQLNFNIDEWETELVKFVESRAKELTTYLVGVIKSDFGDEAVAPVSDNDDEADEDGET